MHLDIHGKTDKNDKGFKGEVDVGVESLKEWVGKNSDHNNFVKPIVENMVDQMNNALKGVTNCGEKVWFN